jgi:acetyltransferase-like isoleucine patch superfamily enzyme
MKRKINRVIFHILKFLIGITIYFNGRIYMKLYTKLLKYQGIQFKGEPRFIAKSVKFDDFDRIIIGDRFVASMNVHFLTHDYSYTTSLIANNKKPTTDIAVLKNISVGDNVFIGLNAIIMPGTTIGNNVIIGAGSVVRGVINDYSIIAGNPAVFIRDIREQSSKIENNPNQDFYIDKN